SRRRHTRSKRDWSSDVCSSDLLIAHDISDHFQNFKQQHLKGQLACDSKASAIRYKMALDKIGKVTSVVAMSPPDTREGHDTVDEIGRASCRERVEMWGVDGAVT